MERRDFLTAILAISLVPSTGRAKSPRMRELERQVRENFGDDADAIMSLAREACQESLDLHPDLDANSEEDLELITEIALQKCIERLRSRGLWD